MSYEYTDGHRDVLTICGADDSGLVSIDANSVDAKREDAPAIALAILEAAGIKPAWDEEAQSNPERWASKAVEALTYSVKHRAEIAEREAEVVRVREYTEAVLGHRLPETYRISDLDRRQYRAARKFFEEQ